MPHDFQHQSQDERLSLAEQIEDIYRKSALQRRQAYDEAQRQGKLGESR
jgi:hypothetical protein